MDTVKTLLILSISILAIAAYLAFPRYEIKVISYAYPATVHSSDKPYQMNKSAGGHAVVFRHDRWTGKVDYCYSTSQSHTWISILPPTGE